MAVRRFVALLMVAVVALVGAACSPDAPPVEPSPTPTRASIPPPETDLERAQREGFEAAEKNYRALRALYGSQVQVGGSSPAPKALRDLAVGETLKSYTSLIETYKTEEYRARGRVRIIEIAHRSFSEKEIELQTCEDGSGVSTVDSTGKIVTRGYLGRSSVVMRYSDDRWKTSSIDVEKVNECEL